jgi:hypothetical protein
VKSIALSRQSRVAGRGRVAVDNSNGTLPCEEVLGSEDGVLTLARAATGCTKNGSGTHLGDPVIGPGPVAPPRVAFPRAGSEEDSGLLDLFVCHNGPVSHWSGRLGRATRLPGAGSDQRMPLEKKF